MATKRPRIPAAAHLLNVALAICLIGLAAQSRGFQTSEASRRTSSAKAEGKARLWPGSRFTESDRRRAIIRGLRFVYRNALQAQNFDRYGPDYLWCFYTISASVSDEAVRRMAHEMGVERARRWRQLHTTLPARLDANDLIDFVFGSDAADSLGVPDERIKNQIKQAIPRFSVSDLLYFAPATEPPPTDVPRACAFDNLVSPRGSRACLRCGRPLGMRSRYDVWCEALVNAYTGERYGVRLGAGYLDVLKWLPTLRPYRGSEGGTNKDFVESVYAVTHVVYTLNDYDQNRLSPELLPDEYEFLKKNLRQAIARKDQDMLGEFIDSLKSLGLTEDDRGIQLGVEYLLAHQNADGSWGNPRAKDNHDRYHPTWNGIVALSNYTWRGAGANPANIKFLRDLNGRNRRPN